MPDSRPNILFLFPDQWRWDFLGCHDGSATPYGNAPVQTPTIDALAARGTRFTQCRSNAPLCAPARACLARGVRYERCGVADNNDVTPTDPPTVFRLLRDAGYHTITCGKSDLFKPIKEPNPSGYAPIMDALGFADGIDHRGKGDAVNHARRGIPEPYTNMLAERGLLDAHLADHPDPRPLNRAARPSALPASAHTDVFCADNALALLDRAPDDQPRMMWVNFPGPHDPYDPPHELADLYADANFPPVVDPRVGPPSHRNAQADRRHYAASCTLIDRLCQRLLDRLEATGQLDHTLVVFASDHGDLLGDHGLWAKRFPYEGSVHVPLILAGPGVPQGETRHEPVELIDLGPTLLAAAGLTTPDHFDARPLSTHGGQPRDLQLSSLANWQMACDGRFKLIRQISGPGAGSGVLYDLHDPVPETTSRHADHPDLAARLNAALNDHTAKSAGAIR